MTNRPIVYAPVMIDMATKLTATMPIGAHVARYLYNNFEYKLHVDSLRNLLIQLPDGTVVAVDISLVIRQTLRAAGFEAAEPKWTGETTPGERG